MAFAFLHPPSRADQHSASELLGPEDPLAQVLTRLAETFAQLLVSAVILLAAAVWLAAGQSGGAEFVAAGTAVLLALGCRAGQLVSDRNQLVVDLIIRGEEHAPLLDVARLRRRFLDPKTRRRLARTMDNIHAAAVPPRRSRGLPLNARVLGLVERELEQVIGALCADRASARGVACAYRLVTRPGSPLYGDDVLALREELNQIRFLLEA